jgi:hypothetical protein
VLWPAAAAGATGAVDAASAGRVSHG